MPVFIYIRLQTWLNCHVDSNAMLPSDDVPSAAYAAKMMIIHRIPDSHYHVQYMRIIKAAFPRKEALVAFPQSRYVRMCNACACIRLMHTFQGAQNGVGWSNWQIYAIFIA